jgi:hypothetical protein
MNTASRIKEWTFKIAPFRQLKLSIVEPVYCLILRNICRELSKAISFVAIELYQQSLNCTPSLRIADLIAVLKTLIRTNDSRCNIAIVNKTCLVMSF